MKEVTYELHRIEWRGIDIEVRFCPDWSQGHAHLEVKALCHSPLPITETSYRSHFTRPENIEAYGGPAQFVETWLNEAADNKGWRNAEEARKQLTLF